MAEGPGWSWENPVVLNAGGEKLTLIGPWELPPFLEVVSEGGKVVLNVVEARALAPVIDVVVSGHVPLLLVVPPTWGVDVSALRESMMSLVVSTVRSRPEVGHPRIVLRGQSSQVIRVRTPKPRDLRALRKRHELQDRAR